MDKLDFRKADKAFCGGKPGRWDRLTLPEMRFLAHDGAGDPGGPAFAEATKALYGLAYRVKFAAKADGRDFAVPPLEALWWADDPTVFVTGARAAWRWRALIRLPDWVSDEMLAAARAKKAITAPVALIPLAEGDCLQTLHVGSYADEAPALAALHHEVIPGLGLTFAGPHH